MVLKKKFFPKLIMIMLCLLTPMIAGAVNFTQSITMETDKSGILKLIYSEKESIVKEKNYVVGQLPFSKERSEEFFNSANSSIRIFTVAPDPKDNSLLQVIVGINIKDVNKINELKALSNAQVSITQTDSGNVFKYFITPAFTKANFIDNVYTILIPNVKVKSSNGELANGGVSWFRGKEFLNLKPIYLFATLEADNKTTTEPTSAGNEKEKSCGLFGLELPIILLFGLTFSGRLWKRKS